MKNTDWFDYPPPGNWADNICVLLLWTAWWQRVDIQIALPNTKNIPAEFPKSLYHVMRSEHSALPFSLPKSSVWVFDMQNHRQTTATAHHPNQ